MDLFAVQKGIVYAPYPEHALRTTKITYSPLPPNHFIAYIPVRPNKVEPILPENEQIPKALPRIIVS